jgi:hypothetical protein
VTPLLPESVRAGVRQLATPPDSTGCVRRSGRTGIDDRIRPEARKGFAPPSRRRYTRWQRAWPR